MFRNVYIFMVYNNINEPWFQTVHTKKRRVCIVNPTVYVLHVRLVCIDIVGFMKSEWVNTIAFVRACGVCAWERAHVYFMR